jgi:Trk-type K+ transport system membrane component
MGKTSQTITTFDDLQELTKEKLVKEKQTPSEIKERAREKVAFILVFGFLALLLSSLLFSGTVDDAIKLIQTVSSALSGLVGAVLGYYYGTSGLEKSATTTTEK